MKTKQEEEKTDREYPDKWSIAERIASKITGKQFTILFIVIVVAWTIIEVAKLTKD